MCTWKGSVRSTYVDVKDVQAFKAWVKSKGLDPITLTDTKDVAFVSGRDTVPELPSDDFLDELSGHLIDGVTIIVFVVGTLEGKDVRGASWAVTSSGVVGHVDIFDVYEAAVPPDSYSPLP